MAEKMTLLEYSKAIRKHLCMVGQPSIKDSFLEEVADAIDAHLAQPAQAVDAWMTEDGRVISGRQKATSIKDGGASTSSVAPYTVPLTRAIGNAQAEGWRPIDTAPEGQDVLTWAETIVPWCIECKDKKGLWERRDPAPTHWTPLPPPPRPEE